MQRAAATAAAIAEAHYLGCLCLLSVGLCYFDVRHTRLFGTSHLTGTWLHHALRMVGYEMIIRLTGQPAAGRSCATLVYTAPTLHALASYAVGRWWMRLDERSTSAAHSECVFGLAASYALSAATLIAL